MTSKLPKSQILNRQGLRLKAKQNKKLKKKKRKRERKKEKKKTDLSSASQITTWACSPTAGFSVVLYKTCAVCNKFRAKDRFWKVTVNSTCTSQILIFLLLFMALHPCDPFT